MVWRASLGDYGQARKDRNHRGHLVENSGSNAAVIEFDFVFFGIQLIIGRQKCIDQIQRVVFRIFFVMSSVGIFCFKNTNFLTRKS